MSYFQYVSFFVCRIFIFRRALPDPLTFCRDVRSRTWRKWIGARISTWCFSSGIRIKPSDCVYVFIFVPWLSRPAYGVFVFQLYPPARASTDLTGLQVLAGEARSGEGARLPLQDYDLRPQPADQQLLTARLVLLENHQSTVWWRKRCLRENDTWDYPLARKLWWVEENGPKIDTEYIYILLIDWPNPLMVDRSIPIFI